MNNKVYVVGFSMDGKSSVPVAVFEDEQVALLYHKHLSQHTTSDKQTTVMDEFELNHIEYFTPQDFIATLPEKYRQ